MKSNSTAPMNERTKLAVVNRECGLKCDAAEHHRLTMMLRLSTLHVVPRFDYGKDIFLVSTSKFVLFADDTTVLLSGTTIISLINLLKSELQNIFEWIKVNNLSINTNKSCCVFFGPKIVTNFALEIKDITINKVPLEKFLGLIATLDLSWFATLYELKHKFPNHILKLLYYSLIYPYLI
ncbi:hypothetical protein HELRODRAFT_171335 [Helobdella robusta]|uniref:Reverse transcriptase domain-containing protein n=1 Tax=Helobdella robusta TaxID=6412 RepID=T1F447_HELRO|nr:hypothetical protein HELRODRAFT_171335 [Helobdella robusta]ESO05675.1 hypothetical protein HELRODRAFT_171335 [Helobdella robusta]